jgi:hypothetical protein
VCNVLWLRKRKQGIGHNDNNTATKARLLSGANHGNQAGWRGEDDWIYIVVISIVKLGDRASEGRIQRHIIKVTSGMSVPKLRGTESGALASTHGDVTT